MGAPRALASDRAHVAPSKGAKAQRLASGGDRLVQGVGIGRASPHESALGQAAAAALERPGEVLKGGGDFGQQRRRGTPRTDGGVRREQRSDHQRHDAAQQRVEEALAG